MQSILSNEYGIVLLAAGKSSRLGRPKQLLPFEGSTLVKKAATLALEISNKVVVVTGAETEKLEEDLGALPLHMTYNPFFEEGIASSIRTGVTTLVKIYGQMAGAIFIVCDQPYLQADLLQQLIDTAHKTNKGI